MPKKRTQSKKRSVKKYIYVKKYTTKKKRTSSRKLKKPINKFHVSIFISPKNSLPKGDKSIESLIFGRSGKTLRRYFVGHGTDLRTGIQDSGYDRVPKRTIDTLKANKKRFRGVTVRYRKTIY